MSRIWSCQAFEEPWAQRSCCAIVFEILYLEFELCDVWEEGKTTEGNQICIINWKVVQYNLFCYINPKSGQPYRWKASGIKRIIIDFKYIVFFHVCLLVLLISPADMCKQCAFCNTTMKFGIIINQKHSSIKGSAYHRKWENNSSKLWFCSIIELNKVWHCRTWVVE